MATRHIIFFVIYLLGFMALVCVLVTGYGTLYYVSSQLVLTPRLRAVDNDPAWRARAHEAYNFKGPSGHLICYCYGNIGIFSGRQDFGSRLRGMLIL